ncbi:MAG: 30S ribosome-binding factor RbfA [Candidatus Cloacimonetes bacterium]|nr:30S ribosome-binding factor RbfA [Candidatus Cloacimonadota bacterium]
MSNYKIPRLEKELFKLINNALLFKVRDDSFSQVIITGVSLSHDLRYMKLFYFIENKAKIKKIEEKLQKVSGFLKKQIAGAGIMRIIPELNYKYDETEEKSRHIEAVLASIREESYDDSSSDFSLDEFLIEDEFVPEDFEDMEELDDMFDDDVLEEE